MAKLSFLKRIVSEDYDKQYQSLVSKLSYIINTALEAIAAALNKGLTFEDNFNSQVKDLELTVDSDSVPQLTTSFKYELKTQCIGIIVIRATAKTAVITYPTSQPWVSFSESNGQINILKITGIQSGTKYQLRLVAFGA